MSIFQKTLVAASLALGAMAGNAHADVVGFSGVYAPGQWSTTLSGTPGGGGAPVGVTNDGSTLTLTGGDGACLLGPCQLLYGITVPGPEQALLFHWAYDTTDIDGPAFEAFGIVVDGVYTQLTDPGGSAFQSGDYRVSLTAGSQFAWYVDCADCILGNAVATITNFQALPEPASLALVGFGLLAAAAGRRRHAA
jgi:hypothetical protein